MPAVPQPAHSLPLSSSVVFAVSLVVQLVGLVGTIFLYKHFLGSSGAALIGTAQFFLLIASSISNIGSLRLEAAYTFFLARGKPPEENTATYFVLRTAMVASAGLILFVIAPLSIGGVHIVQGSADFVSFGLFMAMPLLWSVSTVYNQLYVGLGNSLRAQLPSLVEVFVRLPALVWVAYNVAPGSAVEGITIAYALGAAASAAFSFPQVLPRLRAGWKRAEATALFRFAWPLMGSLVLTYFVTNMVPLIVNAGLGHADLSIFLAANGWRVLVLSLPLAVTTPLFPYLAGLHRQARYEDLRRGTWQALRYASMLLVPGVVALVTYRHTFLDVFMNQTYANAGAVPLAILVAGALPLALSQIIQTSINAIGRRRLELYISSTQVAVLLFAVFVLMPPWGVVRPFPGASGGLIAAAVAVLLSSCVALVLNTYFMETLIRVHIDPLSIGRITLSAAGSFASLSLLNRTVFFPVVSGIQLLAAVFVGFVVYFLLLAAVGELAKSDVGRIGLAIGLPAGLVGFFRRFCWKKESPELPPVDLARARGLAATELPEPFSGTTELPQPNGDVPTGEEEGAEPSLPRTR